MNTVDKNKNTIILVHAKESLGQSLLSDTYTLIVISYCVYISQDSLIWTIVSLILFAVYMATSMPGTASPETLTFNSYKTLQKWAQTHDEQKQI